MEEFCGLCSLTKGAYFIGGIDIAWKILIEVTLLFGLIRLNHIDPSATQDEADAMAKSLLKYSIVFMFVALIPSVMLIIGARKRIAWFILVWIIFTVLDMVLYFCGLITIISTVLWIALYVYLIISMWYLYKQIKAEQTLSSLD